MSTPLPIVDMTGAVVGQVFKLDFSQFVKFNPANMDPAHIGLFNESGCGTQIMLQASGNGQYLPAGAWVPFEIAPNDSSLTATVTYVLPNPPVSQLNAVYYAPGESVPTNYTLGNSPIGIGGSVQTSSVQTWSNEGNAVGTLVGDLGDTAFSQLFTIYTDGHCLWAVDQSGVKHQVLKIQTAGNPLQLGQAADTTEVLGNLTVDGTSTVTGATTATGIINANGTILLPNASFLKWKDHLGSTQSIMELDSSDNIQFFLTSAGDRLIIRDSTGAETYLDLQPNVIIIGDATTKLPVTMHGNVTVNDGFLHAVGAGGFTVAGGATSLDFGNITTDNAGTLTVGGAVKTNTIKDNVNGNAAIDLSTGTGAVKFPQTATFQGSAIVDGTFFVDGGSSLDLGAITTDGLGNITALVGLLMSGQLQLTKAATVVNGSVAGTLSLYAPLWGSGLKVFVCTANGYNSSSNPTFSLPGSAQYGAFLVGAFGNTSITVSFINSGTLVTEQVMTPGNPGTNTGTTSIKQNSIGFTNIAFNQFGWGSTLGAVVNTTIVWIGV